MSQKSEKDLIAQVQEILQKEHPPQAIYESNISQFFQNKPNQKQKYIFLQKQSEQQLKKHQITITDQYSEQIKILRIEHTPTFEVNLITVKYGFYIQKFTFLNLGYESQLHDFCEHSHGSFGRVYKLRGLNNQNLVVKCLMLPNSQHSYFSVILKEIFLMKIASVLKIGPKMYKNNFDFVVYEKCVEVEMEQCKPKFSSLSQHKQQLLNELKILHSLQIVHFDVKPDNICFSKQYNKAVFIDFGFSQCLKDTVGFKTYTDYRGTLQFSSPQMREIFRSGEKDFVDLYQNDIYALGKSCEIQQEQEQYSFISQDFIHSIENKMCIVSSKNKIIKKKGLQTRFVVNAKYLLFVENIQSFESIFNENKIYKNYIQELICFVRQIFYSNIISKIVLFLNEEIKKQNFMILDLEKNLQKQKTDPQKTIRSERIKKLIYQNKKIISNQIGLNQIQFSNKQQSKIVLNLLTTESGIIKTGKDQYFNLVLDCLNFSKQKYEIKLKDKFLICKYFIKDYLLEQLVSQQENFEIVFKHLFEYYFLQPFKNRQKLLETYVQLIILNKVTPKQNKIFKLLPQLLKVFEDYKVVFKFLIDIQAWTTSKAISSKQGRRLNFNTENKILILQKIFQKIKSLTEQKFNCSFHKYSTLNHYLNCNKIYKNITMLSMIFRVWKQIHLLFYGSPDYTFKKIDTNKFDTFLYGQFQLDLHPQALNHYSRQLNWQIEDTVKEIPMLWYEKLQKMKIRNFIEYSRFVELIQRINSYPKILSNYQFKINHKIINIFQNAKIISTQTFKQTLNKLIFSCSSFVEMTIISPFINSLIQNTQTSDIQRQWIVEKISNFIKLTSLTEDEEEAIFISLTCDIFFGYYRKLQIFRDTKYLQNFQTKFKSSFNKVKQLKQTCNICYLDHLQDYFIKQSFINYKFNPYSMFKKIQLKINQIRPHNSRQQKISHMLHFIILNLVQQYPKVEQFIPYVLQYNVITLLCMGKWFNVSSYQVIFIAQMIKKQFQKGNQQKQSSIFFLLISQYYKNFQKRFLSYNFVLLVNKLYRFSVYWENFYQELNKIEKQNQNYPILSYFYLLILVKDFQSQRNKNKRVVNFDRQMLLFSLAKMLNKMLNYQKRKIIFYYFYMYQQIHLFDLPKRKMNFLQRQIFRLDKEQIIMKKNEEHLKFYKKTTKFNTFHKQYRTFRKDIVLKMQKKLNNVYENSLIMKESEGNVVVRSRYMKKINFLKIKMKKTVVSKKIIAFDFIKIYALEMKQIR